MSKRLFNPNAKIQTGQHMRINDIEVTTPICPICSGNGVNCCATARSRICDGMRDQRQPLDTLTRADLDALRRIIVSEIHNYQRRLAKAGLFTADDDADGIWKAITSRIISTAAPSVGKEST